MTNPHGSFIWYELITTDADAAGKFYHDVVGWAVGDSGQLDKQYAVLSINGTGIGGLMPLPPGAQESGMRPGWFGYIGVDDVDTSVDAIVAAGGECPYARHRYPRCRSHGNGRRSAGYRLLCDARRERRD